MDLVAARSVFSTSSFNKITNKQKLCRTIEEKLLWCFKLYDADNSGVIDRNEMGNIMEVQKNSVTDVTSVKSQSVYNMLDAVNARPTDDPRERANDIFTKIDINDDGELNREEFLEGCQQDQVCELVE